MDPINTMDCIRIFDKLKELKEDPDADPTIMSLLHLASFNVQDMTVIMDNASHDTQVLKLFRGKTYERPRGKQSLKADASNCNRKGKWPTEIGAYAKLWAHKEKGCKLNGPWPVNPSMVEVVMGVYQHHMVKVESTFKDLKERGLDIGLYRNSMRKAFNHLLIALDMGDEEIEQPIHNDIFEDCNKP